MQARVKEWVWRYGPAELVSIVLTVVPAFLVFKYSHNRVAAAFAATWGGNIGYFGTILLRDVWTARKSLRQKELAFTSRHFLRIVKSLLVEFGVAEVLDSFVIRPFLMYKTPLWLHSLAWGTLVAKFAADLTFYLPAIVFYEWSKKRFRNFD